LSFVRLLPFARIDAEYGAKLTPAGRSSHSRFSSKIAIYLRHGPSLNSSSGAASFDELDTGVSKPELIAIGATELKSIWARQHFGPTNYPSS